MNKNNSKSLQAGQTLNVQIAILNFTLAAGQTKDFKAIYALSHRYTLNASYVAPPAVNVTPDFNATLANGKLVGVEAQNGKNFLYTVSF